MSENEKIGDLLKSFIFFDVIFTVSFCLGGLIEYERDIFIISFVVITLVSYYPLYLYVKDYLSMTVLKEKTWYFRHVNTCLIYCIYRIFLIFAYLAIAIIDMSAVDVPHTIIHLPILSKVVLIAMVLSAFMLILLAFRIVPFHHNYALSTINTAVVNVNITKSTDPRYSERLRYTSLAPLNLNKAKEVYLTPNPSAENHCLRISTLANSSYEYELEDR